MAKAFAEVAASGEAEAMNHAVWLGLLLDREVTDRYDKKLTRRLRTHGCAIRRVSRMSTAAAHAASTAPRSTSSPAAAGSMPTTIW
jgi:hypothetical protein